jgi:hypothetical protein
MAPDAGSGISSSGYGAFGQIWLSGARTRGGAWVFAVVRLLEQAMVRVSLRPAALGVELLTPF